jgi:hypothetical protein
LKTKICNPKFFVFGAYFFKTRTKGHWMQMMRIDAIAHNVAFSSNPFSIFFEARKRTIRLFPPLHMRTPVLSSLGVIAMISGSIALIVFLSSTSIPAQAAVSEVNIDSTIALATDGDLNGNGRIDANDTVTLRFVVTNNSAAHYSFLTLRVPVDRSVLRRFWNIRGTADFKRENTAVVFPHLVLPSHGMLDISVDATVNSALEGNGLILAPVLSDSAGMHIAGQEIQKNQPQSMPSKTSKLPAFLSRVRVRPLPSAH